MKKNVGILDKYIRIAVGLALLVIVYIGEGSGRWFGLLGILPIISAFFNYCPLYSVLKLDTLEKKHK